MAAKRRINVPTLEAIDDIWQRRATAAAIISMRQMLNGGNIPLATPISRLTDIELGWLHAAGLFGWISTRAEQATAEGWDVETTLRQTGLDPEPWDAAAIAHILPELSQLPDIDWRQPVTVWTKDVMIRFLLEATKLIHKAMAARDAGGRIGTNRTPLAQMQHIVSAAAAGPPLAPDEFDDPIPF